MAGAELGSLSQNTFVKHNGKQRRICVMVRYDYKIRHTTMSMSIRME